MKIVLEFLSCYCLAYAIIYYWHKLLNVKFNFKSVKVYIFTAMIAVITMFNFTFVNSFVRVTIITIILMLFFKYLFKENLQKIILTPIYGQLVLMFAETSYALIMTSIFKSNVGMILETQFGKVFTNVFILGLFIIIMYIPFFKKFYNILLKFTNKIRHLQLILFCLIILIFFNIYTIIAFFKIQFSNWIAINISLILICSFIVAYSFKTKNSYNIVNDKYSIAVNSLREYENMMTKYRISNHENKNLLLTIRAMILNNEKDILKYIDSIVKEKFEDDEKLLFKMSVIPSGGLRATIYSGILKIKENNINYILDIDRELSTVDLIELDENTIIDICKILGVFIDNAIDEVKKLKVKNIEINLYMEQENIYIKVSNNYKGSIDVEKIFDAGYTTKDKNHGYGLSMVKEIVDKNNLLENLVELDGKLFSQILKLTYKKKKSHKK